MLDEHVAQGRPRRVGVPGPADRRIREGERRRPAFQHEPVGPAHQAQGQAGRAGVVLVAAQQVRGRPAGLDVVRDPVQQEQVERGAEPAARLGLLPHPRDHPARAGITHGACTPPAAVDR